MRADLVLRSGTVVTESGAQEADVAVRGGRVLGLSPWGTERYGADQELDLKGRHLVPGGIDPHVHLGDQGQSDFEDFESGTRSCAAGGLTTVIDMPLNLPPTIDVATFEARRAAVEPKAVTDFGLWAGLVPGNLGEMAELREAGAIAFKAFVCRATDWFQVGDSDLLEGMREAARLGLPVGVHCENDSIVSALRERLRGEGRLDLRAHGESRPVIAEWEAIQRVLLLAGEAGARVQIVHVSTGEGVDKCTAARGRGAQVGAEVTMHHLTLDEDDMARLGTIAKCAPPLRARIQVEALWKRVLAGQVTNVGSDHSPATFEQKDLARHQHWDVPDGITGAQTLMPLLLSEGVGKRGLPLESFVRLTSTNAARTFGLYPRKGAIQAGSDADFAVLDLRSRWVLTPDLLHYKCAWSPNVGTEITGRIERTILRGQTICLDNEIVARPGSGRFLHGTRL
jgi:allantoinase